ncbi:nitroreductase [Bacillus sp. FJAT-50079]|uniref:nitroreductase family protein n=1 Tax=Bacillus sp. FJAT-50079 TaxID=2833577 RepID=UPI001BC96ECE|nr:nitroreductase [Bacillus sp. FJAT-50079]MBS4210416.1 nitroreductase [Bacillus sp. FJAT-50079]
MDIHEVIKTRRSIPLVKDETVPVELIEQIIEAGTYAPNHFRTEPWRFFVLRGKGREKLGEVFGNITRAELEDIHSDTSKAKIERSEKNPLRAPVVIAVGVEPSDRKNVILKEEYAAVSSCVQNMLLTAHALGLGAMWRTGAICYHPQVSEFFGLSNNGEIIGFLYLGYPNTEPKSYTKANFKELTKWID